MCNFIAMVPSGEPGCPAESPPGGPVLRSASVSRPMDDPAYVPPDRLPDFPADDTIA